MKIAIPLFLSLFIPSLIWNHEIFLVLNRLNHPLTDHFFGNISGLGDGLVALVFITMLMLFRLRLGLAGLLAFILSGIIAQALKRTFDMPRPPAVFEHVHLLGESLGQHSFPSGHATTCGVMAVLALYVWQKEARGWLLFAVFISAAYGRIYGGVHFPLDVVTGFAIGALSMWWCERKSQSMPMEKWQKSEWSWKLPGLLLMVAAVTLAMGYHIHPATAWALTFIVPVIALFTLMYAWKKRLRT